MGGKYRDLTGRQFGRLTVIERAPDHVNADGSKRTQWLCRCSCESQTVKVVHAKNLLSGNTQSCGCLMRERCSHAGGQNKGKNRFTINGDTIIGITQQGDLFFFDRDDYDRVSQHYWQRHHSGYFFSSIDGKRIALHRFIMDAKPGQKVDHINHQKENSKKSNLRFITSGMNKANASLAKNNTSGVTGISYRPNNTWIARLMIDGVSHYYGQFKNKEDAIAARSAAEEKYFGEYSYTNSMAAVPQFIIPEALSVAQSGTPQV